MNPNTIGKMRSSRFTSQLLLLLLTAFYLLYKVPIVAYYVNTYVALLLFLLTLVFFVLYRLNLLTRSPIILPVMLVYICFNIFDLWWSGSSIINTIWSAFLLFLPVCMGVFIIYGKMDYIVRVAAPLMIVLYVITAITTYVGLLQSPEASRLMAADPTAYLRYYPYNIGSFNFIYSFVLLHPLMICVLKAKKMTLLAVALSVIGGLCVIQSEYTTATLLLMISCVAYLFPSNISKGKLYWRGYLAVIILVAVLLFLPAMLDALAELDMFLGSADKLHDVAGVLRGGKAEEASTQARIRVYQLSWETFLAHPIFGVRLFNLGKSGGHSFVLDTLAEWGVVGFSLVVVLYYCFRKMHRQISGNTVASYYALLFFGMVIVICLLNPHAWIFELGLGAPLLLRYAVLVNEGGKKIMPTKRQG